ncbi:MAG: DUF1674 domain-containing protein [Roseococcus sp.]|nr:DUF1674 domain-containing protein [Roseococcus sp.]
MTDEEKPPLAESPSGGKPRTAPPLTQLNRPKRPPAAPAVEDGGPSGPEPTRYNDWERKGRVSDF